MTGTTTLSNSAVGDDDAAVTEEKEDIIKKAQKEKINMIERLSTWWISLLRDAKEGESGFDGRDDDDIRSSTSTQKKKSLLLPTWKRISFKS